MAEQSLICPHCEKKILLSKVLTEQIEEKLRKNFDSDLKNKERLLEKNFKEQLAAQKSKAEKNVKEELSILRKQIAEKDEAVEKAQKQAEQKVKKAVSEEMDSLRQQINEKNKSIEKARKQAEQEAEEVYSEEITSLRKQVSEKSKAIENVRKQAEKEVEEIYSGEINLLRQQVAENNKTIDEVRKQAEQKAEEVFSVELISLRQRVSENEATIEEAQRQEIELRKRQREIEKREKEMELEVIRKIDYERQSIEIEVVSRITEERHFKDIEKEKQLTDLRRQIEELRRKAEQGSQQTQGEVAELELEELLQRNFPFDQIAPVGKGIKGADILQHVYSSSGQFCGIIIWESKNTKSWNDSWIEKLKDDQRKAKAEIAAIMTTVLPKDVSHFACIEDVWVTDLSTVIGLASSLRTNLIQVAITKLAIEGKSSKMEMIYSYLSGTEFKQRVEAIVESFVSMKDDLEREKRAMETSWAKRDKQIHKVIHNVSGMYGDMQGIIGASLPKIDYLELPSPENDSAETQ